MFFDLAALWMYGQALAGDRRRTWLAAGALAGGSLIFKQTGVAAVAAILVHQAWLAVTSAPDRRRVVPRLAALAAGLVCTLSGAILVLGLTADLRWARFGIVDFVKLYAAAHAQGLPWPRWFGLREHLHNLALPLILAAAGLLMAAARQLDRRGERRAAPLPAPQTVPRSGAPRALPVLLLSWLAAATYLAFIGPNPAFHYVPTILPALLLLALWTLHEALPLPQRGSAQAILYRWIALLWMAYMLATPVAELSGAFLRARYAQREDPDPFSTRAALQFINGHSRPGDSIYVWDYAPRVYWEAGRPCPARFTTMLNVQQIGRFGQIIVDDVARSLAAAPPKVILIPWRRAQELAAGRDDALVDYRSLGTWLCAHYRPAVEDDPTSLLVLAPER
jgi:hypothetical protein